jgi:tetratricopeptide (TPR) repeat protein
LKYTYDISTEEFELIEQFLNNELPSEQTIELSQRLQSDEIFRQKVDEVKLLSLGVNEAILKTKMDSYHSGIGKITSLESHQKKGRLVIFSRRLLAAASVLAIISLSVWWFLLKENKNEKMYSSYYKPDPGLITAMGPSDNYTFDKGMVDYKNGDYKKAIDGWLSLQNNQPVSDTLNYFLGMAYQASENNPEAIKYLEKAVTKTDNSFYKDACWYLGLAYLKDGKTEKAKEYIQRSDHPKSKSLLDALNKK